MFALASCRSCAARKQHQYSRCSLRLLWRPSCYYSTVGAAFRSSKLNYKLLLKIPGKTFNSSRQFNSKKSGELNNRHFSSKSVDKLIGPQETSNNKARKTRSRVRKRGESRAIPPLTDNSRKETSKTQDENDEELGCRKAFRKGDVRDESTPDAKVLDDANMKTKSHVITDNVRKVKKRQSSRRQTKIPNKKLSCEVEKEDKGSSIKESRSSAPAKLRPSSQELWSPFISAVENLPVPDETKETVLKVLKTVNRSSRTPQFNDLIPFTGIVGTRVSFTKEHDKIQTMEASEFLLQPVDEEKIHVPTLSYGLDRVLFNQGVYQLQDPRTRVFNFDPYLQEIMPVNQFDFGALSPYITSSHDKILLAKAAREKKKYIGSTSSMSAVLSHFHFLLSDWRPIEYKQLSGTLPVKLKTSNFTSFTRAPASIFLRYRNGTYAIDADKEFDKSNILAMLGKSMEKLLTLPTEHFEKYRRQNSDQLTEKERNEKESYHYTTFGDFLLRSQLDAYDSRLPGTGMFDLKTRCVVSVRMDVSEYENSKGYEIRKSKGEWESFEREYYDMIRAAFLKYSMQVRMGRMDGIFVAFHNTARIFGFQYISLGEMDYAIHGTEDTTTGDSEFKLSLNLLNKILDRATQKFPYKTLRIFFETPEKTLTKGTHMTIIVEPMEDEQAEMIQTKAKENIEAFEKRVLGIGNLGEEDEYDVKRPELEASNLERYHKQRNTLEDIIEGDIIDEDVSYEEDGEVEEIKSDIPGPTVQYETKVQNEASEMAPQEVNVGNKSLNDKIMRSDKIEDAVNSRLDGHKTQRESEAMDSSPNGPFLVMQLQIQNKVNGNYVGRPENLTKKDRWSINYQLGHYPNGDLANQKYREVNKRRIKIHERGLDMNPDVPANSSLVRELRKYIQKGREFRRIEDAIQAKLPKKVLDVARLWNLKDNDRV
ncbi:BgTH12-02298 [Blumeria graminis f. sp. triticale]|uniref:BgTH12-02298 n=1 Tax=Blumeria graminis f. sp. triticale TaxID=1689686 RepID=A0A9W4GFP2_BLUGR|nr:BgTH12-02298 [Blumeria graminis f. sp. triticale]